MKEAPDISDYNTYNERMEMSMWDKLFFLDKIDSNLIVDFGCADGALIKAIKKVKDLDVVGYDIDPKMATIAGKFATIYNDWKFVVDLIQGSRNPSIVLSSVIHEVFHYGSKNDIDDFWNKVFNSGFEYIIIRDMVPSRAIDRASSINDVRKIYHKYLGTQQLDDFERIWGNIENNKQLIHFLLKYKYVAPNWDREVRENYMPITREALLAKIPMGYDIIFHEHYTLPYLLQNVKKDFGIELKDPTHLKLILKKV